PEMIERLDRVGDEESAAILRRIYADEIGHVATGRRWFARLCTVRGLPPVATWQDLVRRHFRGSLKPPFNDGARSAAGFGREFYAPIADAGPTISGLPVPTECGRP